MKTKKQKIVPCLWFDKNADEAMKFYTSLFDNSKINLIQRYPQGQQIGPMKGMDGKVLTGIFELDGHKFMCLDGGPLFKVNPSVSFTVACKTADEVDKLWNALSKGGRALMPLDKYPFSEKYGWVQDRFGVSWQISLGEARQKITPSLLFVRKVAGKAHEAIKFYTSLFENSKIELVMPYEKGEGEKTGAIKYSQFALAGQEFTAMDSSLDAHKFTFNEGISFYVECADQEEVDYFWKKLTTDPKFEQCGWLKDKYGVSWQIIPKQLGEYLSSPDKEKAGRAMQAMLKMKKIVVADLKKAFEGK